MKFEWSDAVPLAGELLYRQCEYSIDFKAASPEQLAARVGTAGSTSLSFATLQIEIGIESCDLLYPWGLFPNTRWGAADLVVPGFQPGRVRWMPAAQPQAGVSIRFPGGESWPTTQDRSSGWICVGNTIPHRDAVAVEYAKNAAAVLVDTQLVSLWLRPRLES